MKLLKLFQELLSKIFNKDRSSKPENTDRPDPTPRPEEASEPISEPEDTPVPDTPKEKGNIMELEVLRFSSQEDSTLGLLFNNSNGREFLCFTLEDEYRTKKVYGETRIPAGRYRVKLRTEGGFHDRYSQKFPDMHKGMLWVQDVPNFDYILIHIGNSDDDSAGCLLVGNTSQQNITEEGFIGGSTEAYKRIYPPIARAIEQGQEVWIVYTDYDEIK